MVAHREMESANMQRKVELRVEVCASLSAFVESSTRVTKFHVITRYEYMYT